MLIKKKTEPQSLSGPTIQKTGIASHSQWYEIGYTWLVEIWVLPSAPCYFFLVMGRMELLSSLYLAFFFFPWCSVVGDNLTLKKKFMTVIPFTNQWEPQKLSHWLWSPPKGKLKCCASDCIQMTCNMVSWGEKNWMCQYPTEKAEWRIFESKETESHVS
jgi:hypothetical protein